LVQSARSVTFLASRSIYDERKAIRRWIAIRRKAEQDPGRAGRIFREFLTRDIARNVSRTETRFISRAETLEIIEETDAEGAIRCFRDRRQTFARRLIFIGSRNPAVFRNPFSISRAAPVRLRNLIRRYFFTSDCANISFFFQREAIIEMSSNEITLLTRASSLFVPAGATRDTKRIIIEVRSR